MQKIIYKPKSVCSQEIHIEVNDDNTIGSVRFVGGCAGNAAGISQLVQGMKVEDVISRLEGIGCGGRKTSCPDQLATALKELIKD